ncbi:aldehyde dehydrogenase family protein [Nocardia yamanashiensis]|uniref:aldehyde dehydrogenase family protein n=1 Tax=Nocardia yamanashiensis TaxID=209247 RepID=UPI001E34A3D0|nr:aldehyde dehydrogenase family protein [Nocardia yamanashiensis]UGT38970.1 aldehyde dehydrogenase family protein [Nocardia yamanashiensis]
MITYDRLYAGGGWVEPSEPALLEILSPHDRSVLGRAAQARPDDMDRALAAARTAFDGGAWRELPPGERIAVLRRFNRLREEQAELMAGLITAETGRPVWFTRAGQDDLTRQVNAYLTAAEHFEWERMPDTRAHSLIRQAPVGVVAALVPWHSPCFAVTSKIVPALLAGNSVVLKVSPENSLSMGLLAELLDRIGLSDGVISVLPAEPEVGEYLITQPAVDMITFTGSAETGSRVAALAGARLKRVDIGVCGRSVVMVLPDAELDAVPALARLGSAQTCFLAPRSRYPEVVATVVRLAESLPVGDPGDPATRIGPMARGDQQQRFREYIDAAIAEGAHPALGGSRIPPGLRDGFYVTPTVLADVTPDMRIAGETICGPVLIVIAYDDIDDALRIANRSGPGLSGALWSADPAAAAAVARRMHAVTVAVNAAPTGFADTPAEFDTARAHDTLSRFTELRTISSRLR